MLALYECVKCGHRWEARPGPTNCQICREMYMKWLNYEYMRKIWDRRENFENKE
jgi:hypothetical protein